MGCELAGSELATRFLAGKVLQLVAFDDFAEVYVYFKSVRLFCF